MRLREFRSHLFRERLDSPLDTLRRTFKAGITLHDGLQVLFEQAQAHIHVGRRIELLPAQQQSQLQGKTQADQHKDSGKKSLSLWHGRG